MSQEPENLYTLVDAQLRECYRRKHNITYLFDPSQEGEYTYGVRLTPWGRNPEGVMYYGAGPTVYAAFTAAIASLAQRDPLELDYDFRGYLHDGTE